MDNLKYLYNHLTDLPVRRTVKKSLFDQSLKAFFTPLIFNIIQVHGRHF